MSKQPWFLTPESEWDIPTGPVPRQRKVIPVRRDQKVLGTQPAKRVRTKEDLPVLLTVREAADYLGVRCETVYAWIGEGSIKPIRLGQRNTRVTVEDLQRFTHERTS